MRKLMIVMLGGILFVGVGCQNKNEDGDHMDKKGAMSKKDVCDHCPGVQHATANGTCEMCGAKVKG
jgi:uncharacterized paraquat-inducible protein A